MEGVSAVISDVSNPLVGVKWITKPLEIVRTVRSWDVSVRTA